MLKKNKDYNFLEKKKEEVIRCEIKENWFLNYSKRGNWMTAKQKQTQKKKTKNKKSNKQTNKQTKKNKNKQTHKQKQKQKQKQNKTKQTNKKRGQWVRSSLN